MMPVRQPNLKWLCQEIAKTLKLLVARLVRTPGSV